MPSITNGKASFTFDRQSNFTCKMTYTVVCFCETYSSWLVTSIAFEKFLAIYFPIYQRSINQIKFAKFTVTFVFILSVLTAIPMIWISGKMNIAYIGKEVCAPTIVYKEIILSIAICYGPILNVYLYPGICQVLLSILISGRMFMDSQHRLRPRDTLGINESARLRMSRKELNAAITIGLIAFIDFLNIAPLSIYWAITFSGNIFSFWSFEEDLLFFTLGRLLMLLTIFKRGWNLFIFIFKIPNFKEELISLFLFKF